MAAAIEQLVIVVAVCPPLAGQQSIEHRGDDSGDQLMWASSVTVDLAADRVQLGACQRTPNGEDLRR
ncbi:hypothetical protein COUCH_14450 [Couchioplanes caeruleus]|uniref:hypothetical protein n=1 Tax=Couchioplanes caeruleus TaxID=56438 RepID=UPI0020BE8ACD|nr:hypothetical protein [Couchioplanes caeruleus]UQU67390.1 hypothetical protein COUCH_14450 [Couchioplanes caeruleus]